MPAEPAHKELLLELQEHISAINGDSDDRLARKIAADSARKLWLELEEPGDLVDRMIYSVHRLAQRSTKSWTC